MLLGVPNTMHTMPSVDPLIRAQSKFRQRDWDACVAICSALLAENPFDQVRAGGRGRACALADNPATRAYLTPRARRRFPPPPQAVWLLKCRALTERAYVDETAWDDEGIAEALLDDHAMASAPRVGTSLARGGGGGGGGATAAAADGVPRPGTSAAARGGGGGLAAAFRPVTAAGRPTTGFARPGTSAGGGGGGGGGVSASLRAGTQGAGARPMTSLGRAVRLGTASLVSAPGGAFIDAARLDLARYAAQPALAKALGGYLLHVDADTKRVLELAAAATAAAGFSDWAWKATLGRAYAKLGLLRDAERQLAAALRLAPWNVTLRLHAGRCALRMDQPAAALRVYEAGVGGAAAGGARGDAALLLAAARVHEQLGNGEAAAALWRRALLADATSTEATACLAAAAFYADQPELAIRHYRRLLLAAGGGARAPAELWANLGLSTFFAGQLDLALPCLDRALGAADGDAALADVWYNVGCVAVGCGDAPLAAQAWAVAIAAEPLHAEARTNLGVLEARRGRADAARAHYAAAQRAAPWLYEPWFNGALLDWRAGDVAAAHAQVARALAAFPAHAESKALAALVAAALR